MSPKHMHLHPKASPRLEASARGKPCHAAFTLIEMVIALAVMGLLGASLVTAATIAFRARDTAAQQVVAVREAMIAIDIIEQELAAALPPSESSPLSGGFIGSEGGTSQSPAGTIEFYALGRDAGAEIDDPLAEGARWVQIGLSGDVLVRRVSRNLLATVQEEPAEEILLSGVSAFTLRFFDGADWLDDWDAANYGYSLPLAVEITLELDAISPVDPSRNYSVRQVIPMANARPDQIESALSGEAQ